MHLLSKKDREAIEAAIKSAEKKTSGEIVLMAVPASAGYAWVLWAWAAIGVGIASIIVGCISTFSWGLSALQLLEWQIVGALAGMGLSLIPFCRRLLISKKVMAAKVHRESLAHFVGQGIASTKDRTGILIYVSIFEHRVEILGDRGIHAIVGKAYWDAQVKHIIDGIHAKRAGQAMIEAITQMGDKLAEHFPPNAHNPNELPDTVK